MDWTKARLPDEALIEEFRANRKARRWTQDQTASFLRANGLEWNRTQVDALEKGFRKVTVNEFFTLIHILDLRLDGPIALPHGLEVTGPHGLADVIDGTPSMDDVRAWMEQDENRRRRNALMKRNVTVADTKAAKKLNTTTATIRRRSMRAWGRTLTEERDARVYEQLGDRDVDDSTLYALRGHVTRQLLTEIQPKKKGK